MKDNASKKVIQKGEVGASPATFVVTVKCRQNATWQGSVQWLEKKKTLHFRSTLELIRLMDEAVAEQEETLEPEPPADWSS